MKVKFIMKSFCRLMVMLVLAGILVSSGCDSEPTTSMEARPTRSEKTMGDESRRIVLAVHPYDSPVELTRQFAPLLGYLSKRLSMPFTLLVSKSYETHIDFVGGNEVDIALMGPASYVTMSERYGNKKLLCCFEVNGSPTFQGFIIVRKDNPAASLKDLKGRSFASSSRESTMSYVVPRYMFIQEHIPFPDKHLRIVGSHNNVCLNVLAGDVNAGGIREKTYQKYKDRGLKVIAVSPKVTEHPFVATDKLDMETYARVKEALIDIKGSAQIKRILTPIQATLTGLAPVEDKDYNVLRTMMAVVREDEKRSTEEGEEAK